MKVSVAIPCYEMHGRGVECLNFGLQSIVRQTYPDIEVVVSDHSRDDAIKTTCDSWREKLQLKYVRFEEKRGSSSANHNNSMRSCSGEIIKILCQDDFLLDEHAIEKIVKHFAPEGMWLVSSYFHTRNRVNLFNRQDPRINREIHFRNTVGTHSCLAIRRRSDMPFFDENLIWFMDCEYYRQLYDLYGPPCILREATMVHYMWNGQVTYTLAASSELRQRELEYVKRKHPRPIDSLPDVPGDSWWKSAMQKLRMRD